jgi:ABC-type nitrate/sulfonate/bicarbonate transport system substrate-binding protein
MIGFTSGGFGAMLWHRFVFAVIILLPISCPDVTAQSKPEKVRIGYAARAVAHSVPFVAKEAGFFAEEGIDAEIVRTAGSIAPMALVANEVDLAIMSAYLMIPVAAQNKDVVMLAAFRATRRWFLWLDRM